MRKRPIVMRPLGLIGAVVAGAVVLVAACTSESTVGENPAAEPDAGLDAGIDVVMPIEAAADTAPDTSDAGGADAKDEECRGSSGTGSSGTSGACLFGVDYQCPFGPVSIECSCPSASCRCEDGTTFAHDCTAGCAPSNDERERCHVPLPSDSGASGSSGSASSSGQ